MWPHFWWFPHVRVVCSSWRGSGRPIFLFLKIILLWKWHEAIPLHSNEEELLFLFLFKLWKRRRNCCYGMKSIQSLLDIVQNIRALLNMKWQLVVWHNNRDWCQLLINWHDYLIFLWHLWIFILKNTLLKVLLNY